jgi:L-ascorbate metabolism protein UlaG (beta-lactamase superfamily)
MRNDRKAGASVMGRLGFLVRIAAVLMLWSAGSALAAEGRCLAVAEGGPNELPVKQAALKPDEVSISFIGHSTFRIESPGGVLIATDYAGYAGPGRTPDVATMNHAHTTHYTDSPDPAIKHVLRGWNPQGGPAHHDLELADVRIRNVPTDIRSWAGTVEVDGNSIFIFEIGNLCIGHLGHLHHELGPEHIGQIGRLDIVMVPVDGSYTMAQASMINVLKLLRTRLVIPMHYFGASTLMRFLNGMGEAFEVEIKSSPDLIVSEATLPSAPKIVVLPGN